MRRCPKCQRPPRKNDPMYGVNVCADNVVLVGAGFSVGGYEICWDCQRELHPNTPPLPSPRTRDSGALDTPAAAMLSSYLCVICQRYAREDDPIAEQSTTLRVLQADLDAHPELTPRPSGEGALRCCQECFQIWAPVVVERWKREGVVAQDVIFEMLGYNLV